LKQQLFRREHSHTKGASILYGYKKYGTNIHKHGLLSGWEQINESIMNLEKLSRIDFSN
jgi:hypothetical protein